MKLYISGGMTGYPGFNFDAFNSTAAKLREKGYEVINPVDLVQPPYDKPWAEYLKKDIEAVTQVDAIAVLKDWHKSKGATIEVFMGIVFGLPVYDADTMEQIDPRNKISANLIVDFINRKRGRK